MVLACGALGVAAVIVSCVALLVLAVAVLVIAVANGAPLLFWVTIVILFICCLCGSSVICLCGSSGVVAARGA